MSGYVRDQLTSGTIANARLEIVQGVSVGKIAWSDSGGLYRFEQLKAGSIRVRITAHDYDPRESDVSISGDLTMNFQLTPLMPYLYSGIVTDGTGRPVVGATVRGGPNSASTDATGRYEFRSPYSSVPGNVYPPAGYERTPVRYTDSFVLTPGQNITIRRITGLTVGPPATLAVGAHAYVTTQVTFDTGATEAAVLEVFEMSSSDPSILKAGSGSAELDRVSIWGVAPGTATVTGRYFGVSSPGKQVQVVR
jgi:carboxypeptidase family protein